jgi:hypothetical protein
VGCLGENRSKYQDLKSMSKIRLVEIILALCLLSCATRPTVKFDYSGRAHTLKDNSGNITSNKFTKIKEWLEPDTIIKEQNIVVNFDNLTGQWAISRVDSWRAFSTDYLYNGIEYREPKYSLNISNNVYKNMLNNASTKFEIIGNNLAFFEKSNPDTAIVLKLNDHYLILSRYYRNFYSRQYFARKAR